eukprot:4974573-Lingulodinium_polyedra.AAC.1
MSSIAPEFRAHMSRLSCSSLPYVKRWAPVSVTCQHTAPWSPTSLVRRTFPASHKRLSTSRVAVDVGAT